MRRAARTVATAALAAAAAGGLSCKLSLTPDSLASTYHAIKDARICRCYDQVRL